MPESSAGLTQILPYLYLGSMTDALSTELLQAQGITHILNVSVSCSRPSHIDDACFMRIPVNDSHDDELLPYFGEAFHFIDKVKDTNGKVLVHCHAGISRSPTLAIAYLMRTYRMTCESALSFVKEKRSSISPNFNFLGQLLEFEKQIGDDPLLANSKRKCRDDLRLDFLPGAAESSVKMRRCRALESDGAGQGLSPSSALARLRFEQSLPTHMQHSAIPSVVVDSSGITRAPYLCQITPQSDCTPCYAANHSLYAQIGCAARRSVSLNLLAAYNSNCSSNSDFSLASPVLPTTRNKRPMSLSITSIDKIHVKPPRPTSLQITASSSMHNLSTAVSPGDALRSRYATKSETQTAPNSPAQIPVLTERQLSHSLQAQVHVIGDSNSIAQPHPPTTERNEPLATGKPLARSSDECCSDGTAEQQIPVNVDSEVPAVTRARAPAHTPSKSLATKQLPGHEVIGHESMLSTVTETKLTAQAWSKQNPTENESGIFCLVDIPNRPSRASDKNDHSNVRGEGLTMPISIPQDGPFHNRNSKSKQLFDTLIQSCDARVHNEQNEPLPCLSATRTSPVSPTTHHRHMISCAQTAPCHLDRLAVVDESRRRSYSLDDMTSSTAAADGLCFKCGLSCKPDGCFCKKKELGAATVSSLSSSSSCGSLHGSRELVSVL